MTRKLLICALVLALLFIACSPPGDAGTYAQPTRNVWGETMAAEIEQIERVR